MAAPEFYFAWVDTNTPFDPVAHARKDEVIVSFSVEHEEGEFAALSLTIKNPNIGLLSPGRKIWAWFSWSDGTTLFPLFYGRVIGVPDSINKEAVQLSFIARPPDFAAQKAALAETLKVPPYYDPIFIAEGSLADPDTVLEGRSELWDIDRVTHAVTLTDILVGEEGNEDFPESEVPYDSVSVHLNQTPLRSVTMDGQVGWSQQASGLLPMGGRTYLTFTGDSLISGWPKTGASLSGGWRVAEGSALDVRGIADVKNAEYSYSWTNTAKSHEVGDTMSVNNQSSVPVGGGGGSAPTPAASLRDNQPYGGTTGYGTPLTYKSTMGRGSATIAETWAVLALWEVKTTLTLAYDATRKRTEHALFTLRANTQPIVTLPEEDDTLLISLSARDVGDTGDIGDIGRDAYFTTDRGQQSLQYLIAVARAHLLLRSRAVEVSWACRFQRAIALSLRKNARLFDRRLPGHQALGKIIKYGFSGDAGSGVVIGSVTVGCAVGYGGAVAPAAGDPVYAAPGYAQPGWQQYENRIVVLPGGDVGYTVPTVAPDGDGMTFPLDASEAVITDVTHNDDPEAQRRILSEAMAAERFQAQNPSIPEQHAAGEAGHNSAADASKNVGTWREIRLRPASAGPFTTNYPLTVTDLEVPKMIDLEAAT